VTTVPNVRVAVAGGQGAGKSTLVARLQFAAPASGLDVADLPADDSFAAVVATAGAADVLVLVVDPQVGLEPTAVRDLAVAGLLRLDRVVVALTKMDDLGAHHGSLARVSEQLDEAVIRAAEAGIDVPMLSIVPVSAMTGTNVAELIERLVARDFESTAGRQLVAGRFPVQVVIRPHSADFHDYRGYAGRVEAGTFRVGDAVQALPSGSRSTVVGIDAPSGELVEAAAGRSVTLRLADDIDVPRGEMLVADADPRPEVRRELALTLFWFGTSPLGVGGRCRLRHTTRDVLSVVGAIDEVLSLDELRWQPAVHVPPDAVARVVCRVAEPLVVDAHEHSRTTGAVLLIDEATGVTVGAGLVR